MNSFLRHMLLFVLLWAGNSVLAQSLKQKLQRLEGVTSITKNDGGKNFAQSYVVFVRQPLDHQHPELGSFEQRFVISHKGFDRPTVFVTEGYGAAYATRAGYETELANLLDANQVVCEHRYFLESTPKDPDYTYLTVENAAADHHELISTLQSIYKGKWVSTGISKGGQTALYHRMLYPSDVDVTVPYVAPLNFSNYEKRHAKFLSSSVGSEEDRAKILDYQLAVLNRREEMEKRLKRYVKKHSYTFSAPLSEILDYMVLEYPFAFWQWGTNVKTIPSAHASTEALFKHLTQISSPSYFSIEGARDIQSFFIQAQHQLGYYAYDTRPFKGLLTIKNTNNYMTRLFIPKEDMQFRYSRKMSRKTKRFLRSDAQNIILIYGEWDPWSASAANMKNRTTVRRYMEPKGSHTARIKTLSHSDQSEIMALLNEWMR